MQTWSSHSTSEHFTQLFILKMSDGKPVPLDLLTSSVISVNKYVFRCFEVVALFNDRSIYKKTTKNQGNNRKTNKTSIGIQLLFEL